MAIAIEVFADLGEAIQVSGGTDTPSPGASETITVTGCTLPAVSTSASPPTHCYIRDPAAYSELIEVTSCTGPGATSVTVTRGALGTGTVTHNGSWVMSQVTSAAGLTQLRNDWYNVVTQFGADPTGATDSSGPVNAALAAAQASTYGGTVYLPPGLYVVGQILQIGSNTTLLGAGMGLTTIRAQANMNPTPIGSLKGITVLQVYGEAAASNITVRDLTIDGNEAGNANIATVTSGVMSSAFSAAVRLDQVDKLKILGVEVINAILYSIWCNACTHFEVAGCRILSGQNNALGYNDQDGVHVSNCQSGTIHHNNIDTGTYYSPSVGDDGVCLQSLTTGVGGGTGTGGGGPSPCSDISVTGNVIRSATRGVSILMGGSAGSNFTISGNTIWDTGAPWVILAWDQATTGYTQTVTITGNTFVNGDEGNNGYGIELMPGGSAGTSQGWADVTISGNVFTGGTAPTGNPVISAAYGTDLVISGNTFGGWQCSVGIQVGGSNFPGSLPVSDFSVTGNVLNMTATTETAPVGIMLLNASAGTVSGNTIVGATAASSVGLMLKGYDVGTVGIAVTGNRISGWATGIAESNAGVQPDYNCFTGNVLHGCTSFFNTSGTHDVPSSANLGTVNVVA